MMKKNIFTALFLMLLPVVMLTAQNRSAVQLLEKAVANIKADAAVQMQFDYVIYDEMGSEQYADNGSLKLDGNCYTLFVSPMRLWCDGVTQWSYMASADEIYVTEAGSEEAQAYNPVYLMGLYKNGYAASLKSAGEKSVVTLDATDGASYLYKVEITLDTESLRPAALRLYMEGQGSICVTISDYKPKCRFEKRVYSCPTEDYPSAEIVDMR